MSSASGDYRSLLYMPTNRLAADAIRDVLRECRWANEQVPESTIFCLIENDIAQKVSLTHRSLLEDEAADHNAPWVHLDEGRCAEVVDAVLDRVDADGAVRHRLRSLLLPSGVSYGRGPNLASLFSAAIGCSLTHRRDSDVYIDPHRAHAMPIELELAVAGLPLADVEHTVRRLDEFDPAPTAAVRIVGTDSFGAAPFDRRDLIAAGHEFLVDFQRLGRPGVDRDAVAEEALDYFLREPSRTYDENFLEIDIDNRVEMQSCCFSGVQAILPEMPTDIIGCDYMAKDLVWRCGEGLVFHGRKGHHRYSPDREARADLQTHVDYVLRDVAYLQFGRIWQIHSDNLSTYWAANRGLESFNAAVFTDSFAAAVDAGVSELIEVRIGAADVFARAAAVSSNDLQTRLQAVADAIDAIGVGLDAHVCAAVDDYCFLVPMWSSLMNAATQVVLPNDWFS